MQKSSEGRIVEQKRQEKQAKIMDRYKIAILIIALHVTGLSDSAKDRNCQVDC